MSSRGPDIADRYRQLFAWAYAHGLSDRMNELLDERKQPLLGQLAGDVLEIGPGTGANLGYYRPGVHWIGVEPSPHMHRYLDDEAARRSFSAVTYRGRAEQLAVPDASADAVVSTHVLCSVDDLEGALREIRRVLRPGGRFVFIEHVAAPRGSWLRRLQQLIRPAWHALGDGCHVDRETWAAIEATGFDEIEIDHFRLGMRAGPAAPHIAGVATVAQR